MLPVAAHTHGILSDVIVAQYECIRPKNIERRNPGFLFRVFSIHTGKRSEPDISNYNTEARKISLWNANMIRQEDPSTQTWSATNPKCNDCEVTLSCFHIRFRWQRWRQSRNDVTLTSYPVLICYFFHWSALRRSWSVKQRLDTIIFSDGWSCNTEHTFPMRTRLNSLDRSQSNKKS